MSDSTARTYAQVDDGAVAELFATSGDMTAMFSPELVWIDVTAQPTVSVGWLYDGQSFAAPPPLTPPPPPPAPTIAALQTQLQSLAAQIAALAGKS